MVHYIYADRIRSKCFVVFTLMRVSGRIEEQRDDFQTPNQSEFGSQYSIQAVARLSIGHPALKCQWESFPLKKNRLFKTESTVLEFLLEDSISLTICSGSGQDLFSLHCEVFQVRIQIQVCSGYSGKDPMAVSSSRAAT